MQVIYVMDILYKQLIGAVGCLNASKTLKPTKTHRVKLLYIHVYTSAILTDFLVLREQG